MRTRSYPDKVRGLLNEGGLYGERRGWHLPGFDTSDWAARELAAGLPGGRAGVGFFVATFDLDVPAEAPLVTIVAALRAPKGHSVAVSAWQRVLAAMPDAHLAIVGDGEQRDALRALVEELDLTDRVDMRGHVTDEELHTAYLRADVFCQPGTAELQSLVSLEAMSASKPVVLADALALPHLVDDGVNGWLFVPGDHEDLAEKLALVLGADEAERARLGEASHAKALRHSAQKTVDLFEALYRGATPAEIRARL